MEPFGRLRAELARVDCYCCQANQGRVDNIRGKVRITLDKRAILRQMHITTSRFYHRLLEILGPTSVAIFVVHSALSGSASPFDRTSAKTELPTTEQICDFAVKDRLAMRYEFDESNIWTLFVSDVHLGSRYCQPLPLQGLLERVRPGFLYILGDFCDGWLLRRKWRWMEEYTGLVSTLQKLHAEGYSGILLARKSRSLSSTMDLRVGRFLAWREASSSLQQRSKAVGDPR